MTKKDLQSLIDRVIGTKGIMRSSAWWVRRLFNEVIGYAERYADKSAKVDTQMSDESNNAVGNSTIKAYVDSTREMQIQRMTSQDSYELKPNIYYYWDNSRTIKNSTPITLLDFNTTLNSGSASKTYILDFIAGSESPIDIKESLFWEDGYPVAFEKGTRYLVKIEGYHITIHSETIKKNVKQYVNSQIDNYAKVENKHISNLDGSGNIISQIEVNLAPNKYYKCSHPLESLSISLETPKITGILNNYMFEFVCSPVGCSLTVPSDIKWANGKKPELVGGATCQVSIINNLAVLTMFE